MSSSNTGGLLADLLGGGTNEEEENTTRLTSQTTGLLSDSEESTNTRLSPTATAEAEEDNLLTSTGLATTTAIGVATTSTSLDEDTSIVKDPTRTVGQAVSSTAITSFGISSALVPTSINSLTGTSLRPLLSSASSLSNLLETETIEGITSALLPLTTTLGSASSLLISSSSAITSSASLSSIRNLTSATTSATSASTEETTSEEITSSTEFPSETSPPVIVTISAGKNVTLTSSIYSTAEPTSTENTSKEAANNVDSGDNTSILNTENKLFPLGVILVVVGSIIALVTILWFLMKVLGITRRRQRLRGAIPSFVPPERIDFPDDMGNEKYDAYPSVHHHQMNQSNSSWDYMPNGYGAGGRSMTPMDGGNLAGFGVGDGNARGYDEENFIPDFPPQPSQGYIPPSQMMDHQNGYSHIQQSNPFMVESHNNGNSRDLVPVRSNSQSSHASDHGYGSGPGLSRKGTTTDAYGGVEISRSGSNGSEHKLNKGRDWEGGAGGYV
ncbi:hypothetical protein I302_107018 [Kwoniella bestiolae CBS 10118]|uniref:Uncharacterized protein n=1 Tax=Kwoniella bestiolae CBS 10118 TaxID=1296100 RepID=A0A1B9FZS0_9TREE|nr:hypothetical protein I302_05718 [Kwoniella bestiolae CBS 10118]OCF24259.1 hypothetical protein I302_05718 [Kwoniella bestiolae CBS 10118]